LLARISTGGTLAALPVKPGRAVFISEECHLNWTVAQPGASLHFRTNAQASILPIVKYHDKYSFGLEEKGAATRTLLVEASDSDLLTNHARQSGPSS
jgi:hypothetical protein